jgi:hypothetical protein
MDLTIINQIATTNTWIIAAIGALGAIFGALAGGLATYIIENLKIKNTDAQRRQQAYSQLYGRKGTYLQCCVSYFVNFIALEKSIAMHDFGLRIPETIALGGIVYSTKNIIEPQIPNVLFAKSDEFALRLSQSRQDVWEVIGLIKLLFTDTDDKIRAIEDFDKKFDPFEDEIRNDQENGLIEFQYEELPHSRLDITTSTSGLK